MAAPLNYLASSESSPLVANSGTTPTGASASMAPSIRGVLNQALWAASDLDMIAVCLGPGSFTGLRVGLVTAKTLGYACDCPIIGVHVADVLAFQATSEFVQQQHTGTGPTKLTVAIDIGRNEILSFDYQIEQLEFTGNHAATIIPMKQWIDSIEPNQWVTGTAVNKLDDSVKQRIQIPKLPIPTAEAVAAMAVVNHKLASTENIWNLEPYYSRPSAAEEAKLATASTRQPS